MQKIYLFSYDISSPKRARKALKLLKANAWKRQKSVFMCYLTAAELSLLCQQLLNVICPEEDKLFHTRLGAVPQCFESSPTHFMQVGHCLLVG